MKGLFYEIRIPANLRTEFIEPPFSVLDTKTGSWQKRKRRWKELGIHGEIGRKNGLAIKNNGFQRYQYSANYTGTSVFDPVLCELMYSWFCPNNGIIIDPFAGGSVRGIVANYLGYKYTGIELRKEQVTSNIQQAKNIIPSNIPNWICGDSNKILDTIDNKFDFIFTCPPYFNLEVYSDLKDDISNMKFDDFCNIYTSIIKKTCKLLKHNSFACFVVSDVRDKKGYYIDLPGITKNTFFEAGYKLYNEAILLENGLNTAAMRVRNQFSSGKKLVKVHQNVLIFKKI